MKYPSVYILKSYVILLTASSGACWQYFTSLTDYTLSNSPADEEHVHSEYFFGDCKRQDQKFYAHIHLDHLQVLGKIIVRGWLDIPRIPTCIILRGTSYGSNLLQTTAYAFQMCVPRITYCHTHHRFKYHYYEWYLPSDLKGGMNWDLYFFGPPNAEWQ